MWTLAVSLALGAPAVEDVALEALPWRIDNIDGWGWADRRATRVARVGSWAAGIGGVVILAGSGLVAVGVETGDEGSIGVGALLAGAGTIAAVAAPPFALAGASRARRSLRQRGVFVSPAAAAVGWTVYGTGLIGIPALIGAGSSEEQSGLFVIGSAWYASIVMLPLGQMDVNRRGREAAGLAPIAADRRALPALALALVPARNGVALSGAF